jgi:hypothetical protein
MPPEKAENLWPNIYCHQKNQTWVCQTLPPIKALLLIWPECSVIADSSVKFIYGPIFNFAVLYYILLYYRYYIIFYYITGIILYYVMLATDNIGPMINYFNLSQSKLPGF